MAVLVHFDAHGRWGETLVCEHRIADALAVLGLHSGQVPVREDVGEGLEAACDAYAAELAELRQRLDVHSMDRLVLRPGHPDWARLRRGFLAEHTHGEAEIRLFLSGTGLFHVRHAQGFIGLLCEAGDWVSVPAGLPHAFDGGEQPDFDALRLFGGTEGWVARPTGAGRLRLPLLDDFVEQLLRLNGQALDEPE